MDAQRMGAAEAERWGLVNAVVPAGKLMAKARALAELIVPGAPLSVAAIKSLARQSETLTFAESMAGIEAGKFEAYDRMLASEDAREGPRALTAGRPAYRPLLTSLPIYCRGRQMISECEGFSDTRHACQRQPASCGGCP